MKKEFKSGNGIGSRLDSYLVKGKGIRCPDFEILEDFYHRKLDFRDALLIVDHITKCGYCAENIEVIKTMQLIDEGKLPGYGKVPDKLPPKLEDYINKK
jgi:hypothetical protein